MCVCQLVSEVGALKAPVCDCIKLTFYSDSVARGKLISNEKVSGGCELQRTKCIMSGRRSTRSDPDASGSGLSRTQLTPQQIRDILMESSDSEGSVSAAEENEDEEDEIVLPYPSPDINVDDPPQEQATGGVSSDDSDDDAEEDLRPDRGDGANFVTANQEPGTYRARSGREWTTTQRNARIREPPVNVMHNTPGQKGAAKNLKTASETFRLFMTEDLVDLIVQHTNEESERVASASGNESLDKQTFSPVSREEIYAFMGILILRGVERDHHNELRELFSGPYAKPVYRATMSRRRFESIMRFMRFDDRRDREDRRRKDKFAPIREFFSRFNERLPMFYNPYDCVTVDETLRSYRGRCGFVIYMPNKPCKYGLLIRDMCDAKTRYTINMLPYAGRAEDPDPTLHVTSADNIVKHLARPVLGTGRNITADRFYSSVDVAEELLQQRTTFVGTLQRNRKHLPEEMKSTSGRDPKTTKFAWSGRVMLVSYVKKKDKNVLILSTQHAQPRVSTGEKKKPEVMLYYNETKGGVDIVDQMTEVCKNKAVSSII